jgi:hypothetical protein
MSITDCAHTSSFRMKSSAASLHCIFSPRNSAGGLEKCGRGFVKAG